MRVKGMIRLCGAFCLALALPVCGGHAQAARQDAMPKFEPGTYVYSEDSGSLKIAAPDASGKVAVSIGTVESSHLHVCEFDGLCTARGDRLTCRSTEVGPESGDAWVGIRVLPDGLEVFHEEHALFCGVRGTMIGRYVKPKVAPGTYAYEGSGEMKVYPPDASGKVAVSIGTVESSHLHVCEFEGLCTVRGDEMTCRSRESEPEYGDAWVGIRILPDGLEVFHEARSLFCGMRGTMIGRYRVKPEVVPGTYEYVDDEGRLKLSAPNADGHYPVAVETFNSGAMHECGFEGTCLNRGDELLCTSTDEYGGDGPGPHLSIRVLPDGLEVFDEDRIFCGSRATMKGRYRKR